VLEQHFDFAGRFDAYRIFGKYNCACAGITHFTEWHDFACDDAPLAVRAFYWATELK
jgi:hypothetical protein